MTVSTLAPRARRRMVPPPPVDPVTQYALDVVAGRIVACQLVHRACERHLGDLATGADRGLHFDAARAEKDIAFYHLLHHYKGRDDLIELEPWQKFVVGSAFGWMRADGTRRFRYIYLECASKQGKSTIAGGAGLRLAFFDDEPGAEVYAAATKRDQAKIPWNAAVQMVRKSPSLGRLIQVHAGSLSQVGTASFFQPLGRDADSDQGINPNGAIIDELHVHADRDLLDNIEKAASVRRQPMIWKITTAGVKRESVWADERADAVAILEGRATDDATFAIIYTLDEAHTELYGSSRAAAWMIQSCTCRQKEPGSSRLPARSTPTDALSAWVSAIPATGATSRLGVPSTPGPSAHVSSDGPTTTENEFEPLNDGGRPRTPAGRSSETDSTSTGSQPRNTTGSSPYRAPGAPSVKSGPTVSAWTTTTTPDASEGSSAVNAIARSGSSETLSNAYLAHLPTCAVRSSSTLQGESLKVNVPGDDPFDEAVWPKSNPNLGISVQLDFLRERAAKAQRSPGALAAYLRFHMNVPTQQSTRWFSMDDWDACAEDPDLTPGRSGYAGLDLASVRDLTAFLVLFRSERTVEGKEAAEEVYDVLCRFWCPEEGVIERSKRDGVPYVDWVRDGYLTATPGNVTDYDVIEAEILALAEEYGIGEIGFDRWNATALVTRLVNGGASCVPIGQGYFGMSAPSKEFEKLVLGHRLRHGGNPILHWMAGNVEVETDAAGNIKPSKARSSEHIDGIPAGIMALSRWMANGAEQGIWTAA